MTGNKRIAEVTFSGPQQDRLVALALKSANELGYCDETRNVLEAMGFSIPDQRIKVQMWVEVEVPLGADADDIASELEVSYGGYAYRTDEVDVQSWGVESVKEV